MEVSWNGGTPKSSIFIAGWWFGTALAQNRDRRAASLADVWEVVTQCLVHPNDRYAVQTTMVMSMQWGSGVCGH